MPQNHLARGRSLGSLANVAFKESEWNERLRWGDVQCEADVQCVRLSSFSLNHCSLEISWEAADRSGEHFFNTLSFYRLLMEMQVPAFWPLRNHVIMCAGHFPSCDGGTEGGAYPASPSPMLALLDQSNSLPSCAVIIPSLQENSGHA